MGVGVAGCSRRARGGGGWGVAGFTAGAAGGRLHNIARGWGGGVSVAAPC